MLNVIIFIANNKFQLVKPAIKQQSTEITKESKNNISLSHNIKKDNIPNVDDQIKVQANIPFK